MTIACPNCGKLISATDARCFNCGAEVPATQQPPPDTSFGLAGQQSSAASCLGCLAGGVLAFALSVVVGIILNNTSYSRAAYLIAIVLGIIAVALIPVFFPYGRRFSVFVRWTLGTACLMLLAGLGLFAVCFSMGS